MFNSFTPPRIIQLFYFSAFFNFSDIVIVHEESVSKAASFSLPSALTSKYPASKFALIYYNATTSSVMKTAIQRGKSIGAGFMYVTNRVLPNPYDALPSYYTQMMAELAKTLTG